VPAEFEKVVAKRANHPVLEGDFNPIFQGTYSSRIELKQMTRRIEGRLLLAEQLAGLDSWLGKPADTAAIWKAWEPVLFNQTHDLASGVMTDHVYDDVVAGYQFAERLADGIIEQEWAELAGAIDTRGEGIPVVVFNSLGWARTDAAEVELGFSESSVHGVKIFDEGGTEVPAQIMEENRYEDGGLKRARVAFVARAVPALGYAVYHMRTDRAQEASPKTESKTSGDVIENEYYRVTFDLGSGAIASLYDKIGQWEALAGPGNVVSRQVDRGDLWELYRGLDGGSYIAMTNRQAVPKAPEAELSSAFTGTNGAVRIGPVVSEFSVSHGFGSGTFQTRVRLWAGVRRVEIETELVNQEKWVRYQAQFPTPLGEGRYTQEIPFGAAERPAGVEYPAQNWVDFGTSERGVALLNCGMPGNLVSNGTLLLSLMRAETIGGYGYGGGYEPGMSSEGGFELGRLLRFKYALVPHAGDWRKAQVYRAGLELNRPLLVHKASAHGGALPPRWGLAEISANNVVVTALEPARKGGFDLRFYDATGQGASELEIKCAGRVTEAATVNFLEDPGERLKVEGNGVQTTLHPFEIKTIRLRLATRSGNSSVE
jgi:alpha-mannosidase